MDVDTGVDDAMALALATSLGEGELVAVTTVAGNVPVERATENTLKVLSWLGSDVPVYRGMSLPLCRPLHTATHVHGDDGLGGWRPPAATRGIEDLSAPEAIIQIAREHRGEIDGVFVGPLTNLAIALALEPQLAGWFRHVTIMGGAFFNPGNVTAAAEFNIYVDPEAAAAVARSGLPTTWIGLDVTHQVALTMEIWRTLETATEPRAVLVREVCRQKLKAQPTRQVYLHDPLTVAVRAYSDLVTTRQGQVRVDVGHFLRGETRIVDDDGPAAVASDVDSDRFLDLFRTALGISSV